MATETVTLVLVPAFVSGIVIGLYEIILVHRDVQVPTHRFMHGVHGLIIAIVASLAVFNVPFVFKLIPALSKVPLLGTPILFQLAIGVIMMVKIHAASAAIKSSVGTTQGLKETWAHSFIVAALIVAAPYAYPFLAPMLPKWMR